MKIGGMEEESWDMQANRNLGIRHTLTKKLVRLNLEYEKNAGNSIWKTQTGGRS